MSVGYSYRISYLVLRTYQYENPHGGAMEETTKTRIFTWLIVR
jgi:hypothetical protein